MMKPGVPVTILDNEFVTMWYYPDKKIIHHQFHKFLHGQAFREAMNAGTDVMRQYGATKWLSDDRKNSAMPLVDLEWGRTDWFPRVKAAGWKFWAMVLPESIIGQMNMQREVKINAEKGIITNIFSEPLEAMAWLERQ